MGRHGVGLDNVDLEACTRRGIWVVHTPLANVEAVAEHAVALMLALAKRVVESDRAVRRGEFLRARQTQAGEKLSAKTLGIVGFGRIGQRVAEICSAGFAMSVAFTDVLPQAEAAALLNARRIPLGDLLAQCDVVSVHVPLLDSTRHLIDRDALARMKPGALLINTSRGAVIDEDALIDALRAGRISAGLDVYQVEPLPADSALVTLPNVILTPHNASHTHAALRARSRVVEDVMRVLEGETPRHPGEHASTASRLNPGRIPQGILRTASEAVAIHRNQG